MKLKKSKEAADSDITEIVKKKTSRPTLLPESLMKKITKTVANLRFRGAPVSPAVICAIAKDVITGNDKSLLFESGGYIDLSTDCSPQVFYRFENLGRKMRQTIWLLLQKFQLEHYSMKQSSIFNVKSRDSKLGTQSQMIS